VGYPRIQGMYDFPAVYYEYDYGTVHWLDYSKGYTEASPLAGWNGMIYNPTGRMKVVPAANGINTVISYDERNRPGEIEIGTETAPRSLYYSGEYEYSVGGDLTK